MPVSVLLVRGCARAWILRRASACAVVQLTGVPRCGNRERYVFGAVLCVFVTLTRRDLHIVATCCTKSMHIHVTFTCFLRPHQCIYVICHI